MSSSRNLSGVLGTSNNNRVARISVGLSYAKVPYLSLAGKRGSIGSEAAFYCQKLNKALNILLSNPELSSGLLSRAEGSSSTSCSTVWFALPTDHRGHVL